MQSRRPVGGGPPEKTWPRCEPQREQCTSVRVMPMLRSMLVSTPPSTGVSKLGQPVPLSNLVLLSNKCCPQPAQTKVPGRFSYRSAQLPGRSVPWARIMSYCSGVRILRHSASVWVTGKWSCFMRSSLRTLYRRDQRWRHADYACRGSHVTHSNLEAPTDVAFGWRARQNHGDDREKDR